MDGIVQPEEVQALYAGHEVSAHTVNHPGLVGLPREQIVQKVLEDRRNLERLVGYPVRGMSYPFGPYDEDVIDAIRPLGIEYARTIQDTHRFDIPENFLAWHPTFHQFGEAYYEDSDPERDQARLAFFFDTVRAFLETPEPALLYIWGHTWELDASEERWQNIETLFKMIRGHQDVCSMTHIDLVDYIKAFQALKFSTDETIVTNLTACDLFFSIEGVAHQIVSGETRRIGV